MAPLKLKVIKVKELEKVSLFFQLNHKKNGKKSNIESVYNIFQSVSGKEIWKIAIMTHLDV